MTKPRKFSRIVVEPPGPVAKKIIERDEKYLMQSYVRWYPLVIAKGEGAVLEDVDGNRYIDFNSGLAVLNTGHTPEPVIKRIKEQLGRFLHYSLTDFYYELAPMYAEKLVNALNWPDGKVFFTNSGAESIEAGIKVSRGFFKGKRPYLISFLNSFHGRTMATLTLSASKTIHKKYFHPLLPGVIHVPYPYPYRCPFGSETPDECAENTIGYIEDVVFKKLVDPSEVAAFFIEPIQGEGGYVVPPKKFMVMLRRLTKEHGILLVADEVQSGMGRTGKLLAIHNFDVKPDLVALAKGIASGLPLGVLVGDSEFMSLPGGSHANTFGGNPVSLAAADATLEMLLGGLMENARIQGDYIKSRMLELMDEISIIGDVRGLGLMIGVEIVRDRETKEPAPKIVSWIINQCFKRGLLIIGGGETSLRLAPPLVINREQVDEALDILEGVLREAEKKVS